MRRLRAGLPTATLEEKSVINLGVPRRSVITTCAYCGVGCSFKAELRGDEVVRMVPYKDGGANEGHSCVKGRFAWGYATHKERVLTPMVRETIADPWREVSWDEAISYTAERLRSIQARHGVGSIGGITSSRCTNEEVFVVQKMVRAAFGNNNVDTCARVCHSPTGFGLKQTFGTSAGTQDFRSVDSCDVIVVIGANPTEAHPVFASRMKRRIRGGREAHRDRPVRTEIVRSPHVEADYHLQLSPGSNVAVVNAMAHVIVTEDLVDHEFVTERCDPDDFATWASFISSLEYSPEATEEITGVGAPELRAAARLYATGRQRSDLLRARGDRAQPRLDNGDGPGESSHGDGQHRPRRRRVNPLRGQNNVQGSCDMGSFPTSCPDIVTSQTTPSGTCSSSAGDVRSDSSRACVSRTCRRRYRGQLRGPLCPRRGHRPVGPKHPSRAGGAPGPSNCASCRICS